MSRTPNLVLDPTDLTRIVAVAFGPTNLPGSLDRRGVVEHYPTPEPARCLPVCR
jgi:hypothetical protein